MRISDWSSDVCSSDLSPADLLKLDNHEHYSQTTVELRFNGRADSLFGLGQSVDFVAGGYYFDSRYRLLARIKAGDDLGSYLLRSEEHTSELQSLMRISYAVFCLKKKKQ